METEVTERTDIPDVMKSFYIRISNLLSFVSKDFDWFKNVSNTVLIFAENKQQKMCW